MALRTAKVEQISKNPTTLMFPLLKLSDTSSTWNGVTVGLKPLRNKYYPTKPSTPWLPALSNKCRKIGGKKPRDCPLFVM